MKKLVFIISLLHFAALGNAQSLQNSPKAVKDANQLRIAMSSAGRDRWAALSFENGYHLWMKQHFADSARRPENTAYISYYGNATLAQLNSTNEIELAVTEVTKQNANKYRYHIVVNDSAEIVHWVVPSVFRSNKYTSYAYLGKINCLNKIVKFEIYNIDNYKNKATLIFNGGYMPKSKINYIALKLNNKFLFDPSKLEYVPNSKQIYFRLDEPGTHPISFKWSDSINHLSVQMENTLQNDMYHVFLKREIDGKQIFWSIGNSWQQTYYSPNPEIHIGASYFKNPGKYTIIIKPKMPDSFKVNAENAVASASFTVLSGPLTLPLKTVAYIILILLTTGGFMFMMYRDRQRRRLIRESQNRHVAALQLAAVRSQLNPHFTFNALAGIQNLMNKNDVESANKYLSRFARLTRQVLDEGGKELTSIENEVALLNDYLQMEQLRFGFKFAVKQADDLDKQAEIPAMLLQPIVENAVKHGVAPFAGSGLIEINFIKKENDLLLSVTDNGKGFKAAPGNGKGLKLTRERIALLNTMYKDSLIELLQQPGDESTVMTIRLQNWL